MRAEYAEQYRRLWEEHWWWRSRERFLIDAIERLCLPSNARILDVGCGDGLFFPSLERFGTIEGLEADGSLLKRSINRSRIKVGRLDRTFQPGPVYDLVVLLDVLEHIENDVEALESAYRSLKPGGRLLLTVPALHWLWSHHDELNQHFRRYDRISLKASMVAAGFEVETLRFFFGWTVAPLILRKWLKPAGSTSLLETHDDAVTIPPAIINRALTLISQVDHWIGSRVRWPLGSSLIAVGSLSPARRISKPFAMGQARRVSSIQGSLARPHVRIGGGE